MKGDVPYFTARLDGLLTSIECLVGHESPSDDATALASSARALAGLGNDLLQAESEQIAVDGCTHLRWRLGDGPRRVLLLGHHDTVWPIGTLQRIPFDVTGDLLRGPGCFDMKAGVAMMLHAVAALPEANGVTLLITGDEETGSATSRELIEAEAKQHDAVLVLEPSDVGGALKTARKGVSQYEVQVRGRASHAGLAPAEGINATVELAHQVLAIADIADEAAGTTVTPTTAASGTSGNTVPAAASVDIDVRAWTAREQRRVDERLRALTPTLCGARLEVHGGVNRLPMEEDTSRSLFEMASTAAHGLGLPPLRSRAVGGGSDGNLTAALGIPTLDGLGAVGGGAHSEDEHVVVSELPGRTALIHALVATLLAHDGAGVMSGYREANDGHH